jgi:hypothetical protein
MGAAFSAARSHWGGDKTEAPRRRLSPPLDAIQATSDVDDADVAIAIRLQQIVLCAGCANIPEYKSAIRSG